MRRLARMRRMARCRLAWIAENGGGAGGAGQRLIRQVCCNAVRRRTTATGFAAVIVAAVETGRWYYGASDRAVIVSNAKTSVSYKIYDH